jgi:hypothetical protein
MKGLMFMFAIIGILFMGNYRRSDLAELRLATVQFQQLETAQAAGHRLVPGLDQCFRNSDFGVLGYRYINTSLIDANVDLLQPEVMVYVPGPNGTRQLAAVEYIVPVAAWHATQTGWPQLMGHQFHLNSSLDAYVLNIWVWEDNPSGMFEDWNPRVSCA